YRSNYHILNLTKNRIICDSFQINIRKSRKTASTMIRFIPDDLIHPEDLLKQHDFHHLVRVGEGSEADFLIGPVLYTVSYAIAAADDEYDVAFSCVHPFLIFFSEF